MSRNQLDQETSPYLLLHKDNPVHWRAWGPDALAEAETSGKPILLSIGYTACHWCHVMNHESFADQETADLINDNYIPIKVDREERPDIDQLYQTSANAIGQQGGWPLTAFLTPKGDAFFTGSYYPLEEKQGYAAPFKKVLNEALTLYRDHPDAVTQATASISNHLATLWNRNLRGPLTVEMLDTALIRVGQRFDLFYGGILGVPKFPSMSLVQMLLRGYLRSGQNVCNQLAQTALTQICLGGIYDHVGGGMARYSTDEFWIVPHFEKMLYDNAEFVDTLTLAWQANRNPLYRKRIEETIGWVQREMMVDMAFASSIDADSEGEEGKFYLWTEAEIDTVLAGTYIQKFKSAYSVTRNGNYQGRSVLHRIGSSVPFGASEADETLLEKQRDLLLAARDRRVRPIRDDKVQADWNGMMIAAIANAGAVFRNTNWTALAIRAFDFVERGLSDGDRLYHSWRDGKRQHQAFSEDYAHMARAALILFESTNDRRYLERAQAWVRVLNEHFWDRLNGGYFQTPDYAAPLAMRARSVFDQFIPCANGILPTVLTQLWLSTMDNAYRDRSNMLIDAFSGEVNRAYLSMGTFINSVEYVISNMHIVVVGPLTNPRTHELISAVRGRALPNKYLTLVSGEEQLPQTHPAFGKTMVNGQPAAYACQRMACSPPITNPVELSQALQLPQRFVPQQMPPAAGSA